MNETGQIDTWKQYLHLQKVLPANSIGGLKDLALDVIKADSHLTGGLAPETAKGLSNELRLINSYHSNLIEGHKTFIPDIKKALRNEWIDDEEKRYSQELCSANAVVEQNLKEIIQDKTADIFSSEFIKKLHYDFYMQLPEAHRFTHHNNSFTNIPVNPGNWRKMEVSVRQGEQLGPDGKSVPFYMDLFTKIYNPAIFHGDEKLLIIAIAHHRLAWLHPFRDGNGRVIRLFTGTCLNSININVHGLWSLSRGLSRNKNEYMVYLWAADSFDDNDLADFIEWFLEKCLDQILFMEKLLDIESIGRRIDNIVKELIASSRTGIRPETAVILRETFRSGEIPRGKVKEILGFSERQARRIISPLIENGMLVSDSQKKPLRFGFPEEFMTDYFPGLFNPEIMGR